MEKVKVMSVDRLSSVTGQFERFFRESESILYVGSASNGIRALELIEQREPDVVLMDVVLPNMDGFGILERLNASELKHKPKIIILSSLCTENAIVRTMELGASYYMIKPYDCALVARRILEVAEFSQETEELSVLPAKSVDEKITSMFITIGIPAHIKGYQFLKEAVRIVMANPDTINRITKELYPSIAKRFDTTSSKVERAIRHAIEVAWNRGRVEQINEVFGHCVYKTNDKPTNGEFIALMADKLSVS